MMALVSGFSLKMPRWNLCSMEGLPPEMTFPCMSIFTRSSSWIIPLFTPLGVMSISFSFRRTLMLPPADTVRFLSYRRWQHSTRRLRAKVSLVILSSR